MPVFDPKLHNQPGRPKAAPIELASQWVAWDKDEQHILAHAASLAELRKVVADLGTPKVVFQHVPSPDRVFIGVHGL